MMSYFGLFELIIIIYLLFFKLKVLPMEPSKNYLKE